jgi:hypothetical protein
MSGHGAVVVVVAAELGWLGVTVWIGLRSAPLDLDPVPVIKPGKTFRLERFATVDPRSDGCESISVM